MERKEDKKHGGRVASSRRVLDAQRLTIDAALLVVFFLALAVLVWNMTRVHILDFGEHRISVGVILVTASFLVLVSFVWCLFFRVHTLDMQSKISIAVNFAVVSFVALVLFLQYVYLRPTDSICGWYPRTEASNGVAYDILGSTWGGDNSKGCGGSNSYCLASLATEKNRRAFVETFVHEPDPAYLSTETGWHYYWLASANDYRCALFYASKEAQENWHNWFSRPDINPSRIDPSAICIASKKIEEPKGRYLYRKRDGVKKEATGLVSVEKHSEYDRHNKAGNLYYKYSANYQIASGKKNSHIGNDGSDDKNCPPMQKFYETPIGTHSLLKSTLPPLSSVRWPRLPPVPDSSK